MLTPFSPSVCLPKVGPVPEQFVFSALGVLAGIGDFHSHCAPIMAGLEELIRESVDNKGRDKRGLG